MTNQPDGVNPAELINAKMMEMGSDFVIAADIPRTWATGAQAFVNPEFTMLIFREQNLLPEPPPSQAVVASLKNVASVVLPTPVLVEFYTNLGAALKDQGLIGGAENGANTN